MFYRSKHYQEKVLKSLPRPVPLLTLRHHIDMFIKCGMLLFAARFGDVLARLPDPGRRQVSGFHSSAVPGTSETSDQGSYSY